MNYTVDRYNCSRKFMVITNLNCNLNCIYCYEKNKEKSLFDKNQTKEELINSLRNVTPNGTIIKLLGGEPFLAFPEIKWLCENIWLENLQENILFHATSNGTLIHGDIQNWLNRNKYRFTVKLSLDGNKEAQEINRPGSFDKIDLNFFKDTWPEIGIKMTISPKTIHLISDSLIFLHKNGFTTIKTNFAEFVDWTDKSFQKIFYKELIKLSEFYIENPEYKPCGFLSVPLRRILNKKTIIHNCTLGERIILDYKTGKSYPCMFYLPSICGNKISNELLNIDMTCKKNQIDGICLECKFQNICQTCYAANYIQRGATTRREMNICNFQKISFLATAKLLVNKYVIGKAELPNTNKGLEIYNDIQAISLISDELQKIEDEYK